MAINSWTDGLVSLFVTALWGCQQFVLTALSSNSFKYKSIPYVVSYISLTLLIFTSGTSYVIVAVATGYSGNDFFAQATLSIMTGFIVTFLVQDYKFSRMLESSKRLTMLLSREKYKLGDTRYMDNNVSIVPAVLKVLRSGRIVQSTGRRARMNYSGPQYVFDNRGYVVVGLGERDFFGANAGQLVCLFKGHESFGELRIWCSLELSWFPSKMLQFESSCNVCTMLIMALVADEGSYMSLFNWKISATKIPKWLVHAIVETHDSHRIRMRYLKEVKLSTYDGATQVIEKHLATREFNVDIAISMMMILHSENIHVVSNVIRVLSLYFERCFNDRYPPEEEVWSWKNICSLLFVIQ